MFTRVSICALLLALVMLPACGGGSNKTPQAGQGKTAVSTASSTSASTSTTQAATPLPSLTWEQIIDLLTPSTVMIRTDVPPSAVSNEMLTSGTGIVMDDQGDILTNAHVVDGAASLSVYMSGSNKEKSARIVGISPCDDLAVIKVDDTTGLKPATFGKSGVEHVGEDVAAIGYPLNFDIGTDISISRGIISKLDQTLEPYQSLIQTDAAVNHGNSGGPLVNTRGQVIGINTLSFGQTAPGINYAISIDQAEKIVPDLQAGHNRLYLGMNLGPNDYADYFGTDTGLVVEAVASDSPASAAGVQQAFLLTKLAGLDVNDMAGVCKILRSHQDGDALKVQFLNITQTEQQLLEGEIVVGKPTSTAKLAVIDRGPLPGATPTEETTAAAPTPTPGGGGSGNIQQYSWDFQSATSDWYTGETDNVSASIANGAYNVTIKKPNIYDILSPQTVPESTDQSIVADVNLAQGTAGLAVRFSVSNSDNKWTFYDCYIDTSDQFGCGVMISNNFTVKVQNQASSAIKHGQVNTLQLTVEGSKVTFTINGTDVTSFTDTQIASGWPGVEVDSTQDGPGSATFDTVGVAAVPK